MWLLVSWVAIQALPVPAHAPVPVSLQLPDAAAVVQEAAGRAQLALDHDERLTAAARCMASFSAQSLKLESATIRFCAQREGVYDNLLLPAMTAHRTSRGLVASLVPFLRGEAAAREVTHFGATAFVGDGWVYLLVLTTLRRGELFIDPKKSDPGSVLVFRGALRSDHRAPRAFLSSPRGLIRFVKLDLPSPDGRVFQGVLTLPEETGRYQLEIVGDTEKGPIVVANQSLFVGTDPPPEPRAAETTAHTDPVERMLALINLARQREGIASLALDGDLSATAELHARAMERARYFGHDSPDGSANLVMRLRDAGIAFAEAAENIAESASIADAHDTLMSSPGHRHSILNPDYTAIGIGLAERRLSTGDKAWIVVVDFIAR